MNMKFEMETVREIWNDADKSCVEIGPDRDGLGCVEIRYKSEAGKVVERMTLSPAMAILISKALSLCANELENKTGTI